MRRIVAKSVVFVALVGAGVLCHSWSLDGVSGLAFSVLLDEDTSYASGYSDRGFRSIRVGMPKEQVEKLIGQPLVETWSYEITRPHDGCTSVSVSHGQVTSFCFDDCEKLGITIGVPAEVAIRRLPRAPEVVYWIYSESPGDTHYRVRVVRFSEGRVISVETGWYLD